jgi:ribosomal protein S18 acetylase RimI-like enzyme
MTSSRPYGNPDDRQRLQDLLVSTRASIGPGCWHVGDLVWRLFLHAFRHDLRQTLRLWTGQDGCLSGFAIVTPPRSREGRGTLYFDLQIDPRERGQGLEEQMLDWIGAWPGTPPDMAVSLVTDTGVYEDDAGQIAVLERRGFARTGNDATLLLRSLGPPLPDPALPEGFAVRPVAGGRECRERAAAHRDAFDSSRVTDDGYAQLMQTPGYRRDLDLVAVAPDGTFAAFCLGWLDPANRVGEFEPVGTRQAYRRRGLVHAVLLEGLRQMRAAGAESVVVGPILDSEQTTLRLYHSVGFRPSRKLYAYQAR